MHNIIVFFIDILHFLIIIRNNIQIHFINNIVKKAQLFFNFFIFLFRKGFNMKYSLLFILLTQTLFANYSLFYAGAKVGEIKTFSTIKDNYIKIKITSYIFRKILKHKYLIYYNDSFSQKNKNSKIKYKKDKYKILFLLKEALLGKDTLKSKKIIISSNKYLKVNKKKNYEFFYYKNNKIKTYGDFAIKNNQLEFLEAKSHYIKIKRN